jgi:hypothetical protein
LAEGAAQAVMRAMARMAMVFMAVVVLLIVIFRRRDRRVHRANRREGKFDCGNMKSFYAV